jgi:hypothetical protein
MTITDMINDGILRSIGLRLAPAPVWETWKKSNEQQQRRKLTASSFLVQKRILELANFLVPRRALGYSKVRLGGANDGGYVCLDDFDKIDLAFSFGIGDDISWDIDVANKDIFVHQFDHAVDCPQNFHANCQFQRKRIVPVKCDPNEESISSLWTRYLQNTRASAILKMDVEHDEWNILFETPGEILSGFSQIVCEFHSFSSVADQEWYDRAYAVLKRLNLHFAVVHVHGNNALPWADLGNVPFPELLEVTYASRLSYSFELSNELFPTSLDAANIPERPDLYLGRFMFQNPTKQNRADENGVVESRTH